MVPCFFNLFSVCSSQSQEQQSHVQDLRNSSLHAQSRKCTDRYHSFQNFVISASLLTETCRFHHWARKTTTDSEVLPCLVWNQLPPNFQSPTLMMNHFREELLTFLKTMTYFLHSASVVFYGKKGF